MTDVRVFDSDGLDAAIAVLRRRGYEVLGPTLRDDVVTYAPIESVADLPAGRGDEQAPAHYRSRARGDDALFGDALGCEERLPAAFLPGSVPAPGAGARDLHPKGEGEVGLGPRAPRGLS